MSNRNRTPDCTRSCHPAHTPARARLAAPARATLAALTLLAAAAQAQTELAPLIGPTGDAPPPPWAYAGLPAQKPPPTRYAITTLDGQRVLRIEADKSYGNLLHPLAGTAAGQLSWRWRVDRPLAAVNLRTKPGDDAALKVCALFDMPPDRVPFIERQLLRLVEARLGQPVPTATVCYVWDHTVAPNTVLPNAFSPRVRYITLGGLPGVWSDERHDLAQDFLRAFGDESSTVPPLRALAVGADADNTGGQSLGWISELRHRPKASP